MNQGARDANAESARAGAASTQQQILDELKRMNSLLEQIANNTAKNGEFTRAIYVSDPSRLPSR